MAMMSDLLAMNPTAYPGVGGGYKSVFTPTNMMGQPVGWGNDVLDSATGWKVGSDAQKKLRQNPYGYKNPEGQGTYSEGIRGMTAGDYIAANGLDPSDPQTYAQMRNALSQYASAMNPGGKQGNPFSARHWISPGNTITNFARELNPQQLAAYSYSRFGNYDNGLREPFGDTRSEYNGRTQNPAWDEVLPG